MNRIVVVGHPNSKFEEVEDILRQRGMAYPKSSRRENLTPSDITTTICNAYQVHPLEDIENESELHPLQISPVWNSLVLDLMLNNIDQLFWGWSDPNLIFLLNYWLDLDDKLMFVLVYDKPQSVLIDRKNETYVDERNIERKINNWNAYNSALLRFFLRNKKRCILVSSEQIKRNAEDCIQQIQDLLELPSLSPTLIEKNTDIINSSQTNELSCQLPVIHQDIINISGIDSRVVRTAFSNEITENYLLKHLLEYYPASQQLYAELQSVANLPSQSFIQEIHPTKAFENFMQQQDVSYKLITALHKAYKNINNDTQLILSEKNKEQSLVLSQLYEAQEDLESFYLNNLEKELKIKECHLEDKERLVKEKEKERNCLEIKLGELEKEFKATLKTLQERESQIKLSQRSIHELQSKLSSLNATEQKAKELRSGISRLEEENKSLISQLHRAQDELEKYYYDNQKLKQQLPVPLYGAAQRIKNELGYKLGAVMIKHSHSLFGWLGMPWALCSEAKKYRNQKKDIVHNNEPPIYAYNDAFEAERVKKHLSYRLGQTLLKNIKSPLGWIKLPFALAQNVREFRLERGE